VDRRILVVVGFVFASMVGAGACGTNGQCDYGGSPGGSGTFVGRLASVRRSHRARVALSRTEPVKE
jgi:hypothetical protein